MTTQTITKPTAPTAVKTPVLSKKQLVEKLLNLKPGNNFITFDAVTQPKLKGGKSNPLNGAVMKVSTVNGCIQFSYENSVNRQLDREGKEKDFSAKPRKWGKRIGNTCVIAHKGNHYIDVKIESSKYRYEDANGKEMDKDTINAQLPSRSNFSQGTDKEIIVRSYKIENILHVSLNGEKYSVR